MKIFTVQELIELKKIIVNDGYRAKNSELGSVGAPFARAGNINGGFLFDGADRFPRENLKKVGIKVSRAGDTVFTSKGTVGRFAFVNEKVEQFVYSPQLCFWRSIDHEFLDPKFLYYWMNSKEFIEQVNAVKGQTDMADYVSLTEQKRMKVRVPDIGIQRVIGQQLSLLDEKIFLNNQVNEALEAMARAIFKEWFIDFGPVRAKFEGRRPFGMDDETAALFPNRFEESELGLIPKGWEVKKIADILERLPVGQKYDQKSVQHSGVVPVLDQSKDGVIGFHNCLPGIKANELNLVFTFANHTCAMRLMNKPFSVIQNVFPIKGNNVPTLWAYLATLGKQSFLEYKGHWPDLIFQSLCVPASNDLMEKFVKIVEKNMNLIFLNYEEIESLKKVRDLLLPKLISGEINL